MGLLGLFKRSGPLDDELAAAVTAKGFEVAACDAECASCHSKFPASLKVLDVSETGPLWDSTKPYGLHLVVATGKTDWAHDATGTSGTLAHAVAAWGSSNSGAIADIGTIKTTVSSLSSDELVTDDEYAAEKRGDVLVLPFFVWIKNLALGDVASVLSVVVPDLVAARNNHETVPRLEYAQFSGVRLEIDTNQAHIMLCSHRTRDKRCGVTAPIMKKEMDIHLRELGLIRDFGDTTPGGVQVSYINHIGGHKFAANVIIYLRRSGRNIWLARCTPSNVRPIIDETVLSDGKVWPDKVRLVQKYEGIDW